MLLNATIRVIIVQCNFFEKNCIFSKNSGNQKICTICDELSFHILHPCYRESSFFIILHFALLSPPGATCHSRNVKFPRISIKFNTLMVRNYSTYTSTYTKHYLLKCSLQYKFLCAIFMCYVYFHEYYEYFYEYTRRERMKNSNPVASILASTAVRKPTANLGSFRPPLAGRVRAALLSLPVYSSSGLFVLFKHECPYLRRHFASVFSRLQKPVHAITR